jgi:hypothetical protein
MAKIVGTHAARDMEPWLTGRIGGGRSSGTERRTPRGAARLVGATRFVGPDPGRFARGLAGIRLGSQRPGRHGGPAGRGRRRTGSSRGRLPHVGAAAVEDPGGSPGSSIRVPADGAR